MSELLGMDPDRVADYLTRVRSQFGSLDRSAAAADEAAWLSLNPMTYGVQPGGLLLAPFSIAGTQRAAALVRGARADAESLIARAFGDIAEQRRVSERLDLSVRGRPEVEFRPAPDGAPWILSAWGIPLLLDVTSEAFGTIVGFGKSRVWVLARRQLVKRGGRGYYRHRIGALQFGSSAYKKSPVTLIPRRPAPLPIKPGVLRWAGAAGKAAGAAGLALTAWSAWDEKWRETPQLADGERHVRAGSHAVVTTAGAAGGAWLGAKGGALAGALLGSVFPGPGTVIGGIVGGVIGGIVGGIAGGGAGGWLDDNVWSLFS